VYVLVNNISKWKSNKAKDIYAKKTHI